MTGLDISTLSRLTANKHAVTPFGTIALKKLLSEGVSTVAGEPVSSRVVGAVIEQMVAHENKSIPLTDQQIASRLEKQGYLIARRTVSKYRHRLDIPVCKMRAAMNESSVAPTGKKNRQTTK